MQRLKELHFWQIFSTTSMLISLRIITITNIFLRYGSLRSNQPYIPYMFNRSPGFARKLLQWSIRLIYIKYDSIKSCQKQNIFVLYFMLLQRVWPNIDLLENLSHEKFLWYRNKKTLIFLTHICSFFNKTWLLNLLTCKISK